MTLTGQMFKDPTWTCSSLVFVLKPVGPVGWRPDDTWSDVSGVCTEPWVMLARASLSFDGTRSNFQKLFATRLESQKCLRVS